MVKPRISVQYRTADNVPQMGSGLIYLRYTSDTLENITPTPENQQPPDKRNFISLLQHSAFSTQIL